MFNSNNPNTNKIIGFVILFTGFVFFDVGWRIKNTVGIGRLNRYFYGKAMQRNRIIRSKTLAVLDDRSKGDRDLLFTTEGVMPVMRGKCKAVTPYDKINWSENSKKKELTIGVKYSNDKLEMDKLYELIKKLAADESHVEEVVIG